MYIIHTTDMKYDCPIEDYTCPYCNANAECMLDCPMDNCDEYYFYHAGEEEE